jgi:hypothetical protein
MDRVFADILWVSVGFSTGALAIDNPVHGNEL